MSVEEKAVEARRRAAVAKEAAFKAGGKQLNVLLPAEVIGRAKGLMAARGIRTMPGLIEDLVNQASEETVS